MSYGLLSFAWKAQHKRLKEREKEITSPYMACWIRTEFCITEAKCGGGAASTPWHDIKDNWQLNCEQLHVHDGI